MRVAAAIVCIYVLYYMGPPAKATIINYFFIDIQTIKNSNPKVRRRRTRESGAKQK